MTRQKRRTCGTWVGLKVCPRCGYTGGQPPYSVHYRRALPLLLGGIRALEGVVQMRTDAAAYQAHHCHGLPLAPRLNHDPHSGHARSRSGVAPGEAPISDLNPRPRGFTPDLLGRCLPIVRIATIVARTSRPTTVNCLFASYAQWGKRHRHYFAISRFTFSMNRSQNRRLRPSLMTGPASVNWMYRREKTSNFGHSGVGDHWDRRSWRNWCSTVASGAGPDNRPARPVARLTAGRPITVRRQSQPSLKEIVNGTSQRWHVLRADGPDGRGWRRSSHE
jgi:hypothetical protein